MNRILPVNQDGVTSIIGLAVDYVPTKISVVCDAGRVVVYTPMPKAIPLTSWGAHIHTHTKGLDEHQHEYPDAMPSMANVWMHEGPPPAPKSQNVFKKGDIVRVKVSYSNDLYRGLRGVVLDVNGDGVEVEFGVTLEYYRSTRRFNHRTEALVKDKA